MVKPHRKFTPEEKAANDQAIVEREASQHDLNQNRLKQEGISQFENSRNCGSKRKYQTDNDEISVISATDHPKELQGHNEFDGVPHWATPKH